MTDIIFNSCVDLLKKTSNLLEMTYNEINVLIFVIIVPFIFLLMLLIIIKQRIKLRLLHIDSRRK